MIFPYDVCIINSKQSLILALDKIENIKNELLPQMVAPDYHYLMRLIEMRAIAFISELYLKTSLMRTETPAGHYREYYPERDNSNWLSWVIVNQKHGDLNFRTERVPLDRYRFKPTRCHMDGFQFPK